MINSIRKRAVFDTNIFLAAHLTQNPNSPTAELLSRWVNDEFDILYCDQLLDEVREKFVEKGITQELADEFIDDLRNIGICIEITPDDIIQVIQKVRSAKTLFSLATQSPMSPSCFGARLCPWN